MRVFISSGEVSGDIVGSLLTGKIREMEPGAEIFGLGGERMARAGVVIDARTNHLGTVGVTEAVRAVPAFARVLVGLRRRIREEAPDVAVLIGNDVFNVLLARWLRRRGVATVSYFPPQVWIWRAVARPIAKSYEAILTSFPLEQEVYARAGARTGTTVTFVGHYLGESLVTRTDREIETSRRRLGLGDASRVLALLPGSRPHEVRRLTRVLLDAAGALCHEDERLRLVVPLADESYRAGVEAEVRRRGLGERAVFGTDSHEAMRAADVVVLASGTASLEAALLGVPMVIVYRVSAVTLAVIRTVIRLGLIESETVGLPNLLLGRCVVPELRQSRATADSLVRVARSLLGDETSRTAQRVALLEVAGKVTAGATLERVAEAVVRYARSRRTGDGGGPRATRPRTGSVPPGGRAGRS